MAKTNRSSKSTADKIGVANRRGANRGQFEKGNQRGWKKGAGSPNPGGRPKALKEVVELARQESEACILRLAEIRDAPNSPGMVAVAACNSILDRAYGRAPISASLAVHDVAAGDVGGASGISALLGRVVEYKERHRALAASSPTPPQPADFLVSPTGETAAIEAEPSPSETAATATPSVRPPEPEPAATAAAPPPAPAPEPPPKPKPAGSGMPNFAAFAAFSERKQAERERLEQIAAQRPGRQLTREEAFGKPDDPPSSMQGKPEYVTVTRAPGGSGFRRI